MLTTGKLLGTAHTVDSWCAAHSITDNGYSLPAVSAAEGGTSPSETLVGSKKLCGLPVLKNVANPIAAVAGGEPDLLYVAEQRGVVTAVEVGPRRRDSSPPSSFVFLDLTDNVYVTSNRGDERGLLAITFHPKFVENGRLYVLYFVAVTIPGSTIVTTQTRLSEFTVRSSRKCEQDAAVTGGRRCTYRQIAAEGSERVVLEIQQPEW